MSEPEDLPRRVVTLEERRVSYALATVVRVDRPVSSHPGDRGIVTVDGKLDGWVGGSCAEPVVVREAMASLRDGDSRLVRILPPSAPDPPSSPGVVVQRSTCGSEGGLDVFVQPHAPRPVAVVIGDSPVCRSLGRLAGVVGYQLVAASDAAADTRPCPDAADTDSGVPPGSAVEAGEPIGVDAVADLRLGPRDAVVVATMNRYDEAGLRAALRTGAGYLGLVASKPRGAKVIASLGADTRADLGRVKVPAGLDLGPSAQGEIALSILAEMVAGRHRLEAGPSGPLCPSDEHPGERGGPAEAVDPVCGMRVVATGDVVDVEHAGRLFYFCCPHCRDAFVEEPERFTSAA